jgi:hypothetical protein
MLIELASSLENWRGQTSFPGSKDWVFASPLAVGEKPYWPDAVLKRHIFPAAKRQGSPNVSAGIASGAHWLRFCSPPGHR